MNEPNIKFKHFKNVNKFGGVTIGWIVVNGTLYSAVAVCNEKDQFNKKTGRDIVLRRLQEVQTTREGNNYVRIIELDDLKIFLKNNIKILFPIYNLTTAESMIDKITFENLRNGFLGQVLAKDFFN